MSATTVARRSRAGMRTVAALPHWRVEVGDVTQALAEAAADDVDVRVITGREALAALVRRRRDTTLLLSDDRAKRLQPLVDRACEMARARLWWNGGDEAIAALAASSGRAHELQVVFFPEAARVLRTAGIEVAEVVFAFAPVAAWPQQRAATIPKVVYTGEVDIGDDCFTPLGPAAATRLSARVHELAAAVTDGAMRAKAADDLVRVECANQFADGSAAHRIALWSLRNRVRHRLLVAIIDAFGDRVSVRGSDWGRVGIDALPTDFDRRTRVDGYRAARVSLDLGSKSTHAALYPRSAEILAAGGGLVQFDCGNEDEPRWSSLVGERRAHDASALVALVGSLLDAPGDEVCAVDAALHADYVRLRRAAADQLLDAVRRVR